MDHTKPIQFHVAEVYWGEGTRGKETKGNRKRGTKGGKDQERSAFYLGRDITTRR